MAKYTFMAMATPKQGCEQAYNDWQQSQHVNDVLMVPGFISAKRFRIANMSKDNPASRMFCSLYEVETDDIEATMAEMARRYGTDEMPGSPTSDPSKTVTLTWELISEFE